MHIHIHTPKGPSYFLILSSFPIRKLSTLSMKPTVYSHTWWAVPHPNCAYRLPGRYSAGMSLSPGLPHTPGTGCLGEQSSLGIIPWHLFHFLITPWVNYSSFAVIWVFCTSYHNQHRLEPYKYHVWHGCLCMVCTCGSAGAIRDMKKVLYPLELDLKVFVRCPRWVLASEFGSSIKAVCTCDPRAISQSPRCDSLHHYLTCRIRSTNERSYLGKLLEYQY